MNIRWKLGGLGLLTAVLIFIIVAPLISLRVSVDLPPGAVAPSRGGAEAGATTAIWVVCTGLVFAVVALAAWMARRMIRGHRKSN